MPIYEYFCRNCGAKFELLQPVGGAPGSTRCPQGHAAAQRVLSVFAPVRAAAEGQAGPLAGGGCACAAGGGCGCGH